MFAVPTTALLARQDDAPIARQTELGLDALVSILQARTVPLAVQPIEGPGFGPGRMWVEALCRPSVHGQPVSPLDVVQAADRSGMGQAFDRIVIEHAARWLATSPQVARCGINLTSATLDGGAAEAVSLLDTLAFHGVEAGRVCIEVSELFPLVDLDRAREFLCALNAAGVVIAIDDFGNGFSHLRLGYAGLMRVIKLDKTLLWDASSAVQPNLKLARGVKALADALDCALVIEGVQGEREEALVDEMPGVFRQGFQVARPQRV